MTWINATVRGVIVFLYFLVATVWIPNTILQLSFVADAAPFVRDSIVLAFWSIGLFGGLFLLRRAQKRGLI